MLGCGRLVVESPGEHGQLVLTEIPQVQVVQSTLFQLVGDEQVTPGHGNSNSQRLVSLRSHIFGERGGLRVRLAQPDLGP